MRHCAQCGQDISAEQGLVTTAQLSAESIFTRSAEAELLELLRQATLGEYDIAGELGRGGMAIVYLAHDIALDRHVAIKVMSPTLVGTEGLVERFMREARTSAALSHPNIIPIHSVKHKGPLLYFVMKFVQGRTLDSIIKHEGALPTRMVTAILSQVGGALGYAHRHGVVHRDVKPANIMIDIEGWAVVTDFGIAKPSHAADELTATGAVVGTPAYMSPEQCAGQPLTGASDQYALGVVGYEMLTGLQPFQGSSLMELMKKHFFDEPTPVEQLREDCPPDLASAVSRMLAKEPGDRWPTLEDMVAAVGAAPLAANDPIRVRMVDLAKSGERHLELSQISAPTSPVPQSNAGLARAERPAAVSETAPSPAVTAGAAVRKPRSRAVRWLAALAVLLLVVGGGGWVTRNVLLPRLSRSGTETAEQLRAGPGATDRPADTEQSATPGKAEPLPVTTGSVTVRGLPAGGVVYLNDQQQHGTELQLEPGEYDVRLEAAGYETTATTVTVQAGASLTLEYSGRPTPRRPAAEPPAATPRIPARATRDTVPGLLQLVITNTRARVIVDGVTRAEGNRVPLQLEPGRHVLRLERDGFLSLDTVVTLAGGDTVLRRFTLVRRTP
jgi:serine/threonine protein kinase